MHTGGREPLGEWVEREALPAAPVTLKTLGSQALGQMYRPRGESEPGRGPDATEP